MNKVIVIGADHVNTLGVIRNLGENGIKCDLIIISDKKRASVSKSKYVRNSAIVNSVNNLADYLLANYKSEAKKPVIISTSDSIALELDNNIEKLEKYFILSHIKNNSNNKIEYYMDKYNQYLLAKENGLKTAKSQIFSLKFDSNISIDYPLIIKPYISANGNKNDITICNKENDFDLAKKKLIELGYDKVLIQELLDYQEECDVAGFAYNGFVEIPGLIIKENIWPSKKGSATYGRVVPIDNYSNEIQKIKKTIENTGYCGIFDIDFFIKNGELYFNEINFRNGALSYAYGDSNICYNWYMSCVNKKIFKCKTINDEYYFVDDNAHLHNVLDKDTNIKEYFEHIRKSKIKLSYNSRDKKPWFFMIIYKIKNKLFK